ncbi:MAG: L,D-transpeptidase [Deltaproteobacteria bacterium]|nr:L,D-transpeptidase [Deltaproteobacteria bacterium]
MLRMLFIFSVTFFATGCKGKKVQISYDQHSDRKIVSVYTGDGNCLDTATENSTDYSVKGIPGYAKDQKTEHVLKPLYKVPGDEEILKAINGAFRRLPTRAKWFKSLAASKPLKIYTAPDSKSVEIGQLEPQIPIPPVGVIKGRGCKGPWIQLGINAFVCSKNLHKSKKLPEVHVLPVVKIDMLTPGKYAYVRIGGAPWYASRSKVKANKPSGELGSGFYVHFKRFTRINGKNYWKTVKNRYVPVDRIAAHRPSRHAGVILDEKISLPLAFPIAKDSSGKGIAIPVYSKPGGSKIATAKYHEAVRIFGDLKHKGRKYYRIGDCRWIMARHVAAAFPTSIPPGVRPDEKWIDINLMRQTLVAWEGKKPIYATIISTGKSGHSTKHGVFRVYWKVSETDMKNEVGADDQYLAADVPWSLFFWKGQALHGAYWHDDFGRKKSHGCVNLAPRDARFIYEWSSPYTGSGWTYRWMGMNSPGITVQVRRNDLDKPMVFGYARNFIPEQQLKIFDDEFKKKIAAETLEMIRENDDDDKGDSPTSKGKNIKTEKKSDMKKISVGKK